MKKIAFHFRTLAAACAISLLLSSCSVMLPVSATGNPVGGTKTGTATATNLLGFWLGGDASIKTAAASGGITRISTVDMRRTDFLFIFHTYTTTVVGN